MTIPQTLGDGHRACHKRIAELEAEVAELRHHLLLWHDCEARVKPSGDTTPSKEAVDRKIDDEMLANESAKVPFPGVSPSPHGTHVPCPECAQNGRVSEGCSSCLGIGFVPWTGPLRKTRRDLIVQANAEAEKFAARKERDDG